MKQINSKLSSSTNNKLPNKYPSISFCIPPPQTRNTTSPNASIPVKNIPIEASPDKISLACNS